MKLQKLLSCLCIVVASGCATYRYPDPQEDLKEREEFPLGKKTYDCVYPFLRATMLIPARGLAGYEDVCAEPILSPEQK